MTKWSMMSRAGLMIVAGLLAAHPVKAQTAGDVERGRAFVTERCTGCHAVKRDDEMSPLSLATPFTVVARTPGMTETALAVFFRTPHAMMPNLVLEGEEMDDVIAYITSLRVAR